VHMCMCVCARVCVYLKQLLGNLREGSKGRTY